jgi:flagellar hook-associated protein 3 FlgL
MSFIGDLASLMTTRRRQSTLQQNAITSAQSATTGVANDKARHLHGNTSSLALLNRKSELLQQYQNNTSEARIMISVIQSSLERIIQGSQEFLNNLTLSSQVENQSDLEIISAQASSKFIDLVSGLNTNVLGKYIFSGAEIHKKPLPDGASVVELLRADIAGLSSASAISGVIDDWFDNPTGPYQTSIYKGSSAVNISLPVDIEIDVQVSARANDQGILDTLKALAKSIFSAEDNSQLSVVEQKSLFSKSQILLMHSADQLKETQALLGVTESSIEALSLQNEDLQLIIKQKRSTMLEVDQFTKITEFEAMQAQLDISYRIAARQSQVSLAEYLR